MWIICSIVLIVLLDQFTKFLAADTLMASDSVSVIDGLISFQYHQNPGAAWGILSQHRWVFMIASAVAIVAILAFLVYSRVRKVSLPFLQVFSLSFIVGGGIANMIDRVRLGYVIDFLRFDFIDFPIFNVADSFISVGAVLLFVSLVLDFLKDQKKKGQSSPSENDHA